MKKILFALGISLLTSHAYAVSTAGATLSNFQINVISGDNIAPFLDTLSISFNNNLSDNFVTSTYQYKFSSGFPLSDSLSTTDGASFAEGIATVNDQSALLSAYASTPSGHANSGIYGNLWLSYKAFSLLSFSVDATIFGSANMNGFDSGASSAQLNLYKTSFDGSFTNLASSVLFSSDTVFTTSGNYSFTKKLKFFFYDDEDSNIQLSSMLGATATAQPTLLPVPEPETYTMMFSGIGLIGFAARHRKSTARQIS